MQPNDVKPCGRCYYLWLARSLTHRDEGDLWLTEGQTDMFSNIIQYRSKRKYVEPNLYVNYEFHISNMSMIDLVLNLHDDICMSHFVCVCVC